MKRLQFLGVFLTGFFAAAVPVAAQQPATPLRLVVPTPAGGPSDTAARALAQALAKTTGQTVVVENKPGASGSIAAQAVINSPPDGRTLLWGLASMVGIPLLQKSAPFQSMAELTPVSLVGRFAFGMFVSPDVPARSVAELIRYAKANPDKLACAYGTLGEFMAAAQFMQATGTRMVFVPYKGGVQLMPDLMAGRVQLNFGPMSSGLQHVAAGKLRLLATVASQRMAIAPDVPTLAESGVKTGALPSWQAIFAPPKTPRDTADRVSREIAAAMRDPVVKTQFDQQALSNDGTTPESLAAAVTQDFEVWRDFIRDNQIAQE